MADIVEYLKLTREHAGSDLHLCVGAPPAARVNGVLQPLDEQDLSSDVCKNLVYSILTETERAKLEDTWELDFAVDVEGVGRFRGNGHYSKGNVEAVFRYLPPEIPELADLGHGEVVSQLCDKKSGLILVTGVTGAGKTTTLAAMTKLVSARRSCVIITIEDPIEYIFDHSYGLVKQRQIGHDTKSFPAAIRSAMRQDPDVIVVSEMRDLETIQAAITAAETGHLVISTLHTIDAPKSIDRMVDVFPADQQEQINAQLANCLVAVVSQHLIPRQDQPGRVMASEIMINNHAIAAVIRDRKVEQMLGLMEIGANEGMHTIDVSLAHLVCNDYISLEDALTHCRDEHSIQTKWQAEMQRRAAAAKK